VKVDSKPAAFYSKLGVSPTPNAIHLRMKATVVENCHTQISMTDGERDLPRSLQREFSQSLKLAVFPRDEAVFARDCTVIRGRLEGVRLFHIMDLLLRAFDSFKQRLRDDRPTDPPFDISHLSAILAHVLRTFCSEWAPTKDSRTSSRSRLTQIPKAWNLLEPKADRGRLTRSRPTETSLPRQAQRALDPVLRGDKLRCYECSREILAAILSHWVRHERLTLSAYPKARLILAFVCNLNCCLPQLQDTEPLFKTPQPSDDRQFIQWDPAKAARKHELEPFCRFLCRARPSPAAYAFITEAIRFQNRNSDVRHEIFVVKASMGKEKFWVRLDRSRQGQQVSTFVWEAWDTVSNNPECAPSVLKIPNEYNRADRPR
jgi:hypothetical protein